MAAVTAKAIFPANANPADPKVAKIMAPVLATVLHQSHFVMLKHKHVIIIHRNPAALVAKMRL